MSRRADGWRPLLFVLAVALAGAAASLLAAAAGGMHRSALAHLAATLIPAAIVTTVAAAATRPFLVRAGVRSRLVALSLIATVTSLASLLVLAWLMFVDDHDTLVLTVLVLYSAAAGAGAAWIAARSTSTAIERVARTTRALSGGDLDARVGPVEAERELVTLAADVDRMADHLQAAIAHATDSEERRRDLMVAVSHDLRTPLAALRAMAEAVEDGVVDDPTTLRRYAGEMRRSVGALSRMVDDLFELAQLDAGAIERETERARLDEVVKAAVEASRVGAGVSRPALHRVVMDGAGDALCSPRMIRVLQNLLTNAIRHTPPDGTITIEAERRHDSLTVAVTDTGEGIPDTALSSVFEPFWRGDPARSEAGAGLGLALSKRIVEALGGTITATSRVGEGSRFAVTIPQATAA
jgi:signal transduction histidine kinase